MNPLALLPALAALVAAFSLPAWGQGLPSTIYNTSPPTLSNGQQAPLQADVNGNLKTVQQGTLTVTDTSTPTTGTGGVTAVTVGVASAQALAAASGGNRATMLSLQNVSATANIACNLGGTAALNTAGNFQLAPGDMLTWNSTYIPQDAINCIASAASTPLTVMAK